MRGEKEEVNMKKLYLLLIIFGMLVCVCGCSGKGKGIERIVLTRNNFADYFYYSSDYVLRTPISTGDFSSSYRLTIKKTDYKAKYALEDEENPVQILYKFYYTYEDSKGETIQDVRWITFDLDDEAINDVKMIERKDLLVIGTTRKNYVFLYEEIIPYGVILIKR